MTSHKIPASYTLFHFTPRKIYSIAHHLHFIHVQSRLVITRIGYNAVGRGHRIYAARGEMCATANNNAVINCHLFL